MMGYGMKSITLKMKSGSYNAGRILNNGGWLA
jgi:hypothetical protein